MSVNNVGEENQVKKKKTSAKLKREREIEDLKKILDTYNGRYVIWRVLSECGLFKTSYTGEANSTFFNEGKRHIGLWLIGEIKDVDINLLNKMQQEADERDKEQ